MQILEITKYKIQFLENEKLKKIIFLENKRILYI